MAKKKEKGWQSESGQSPSSQDSKSKVSSSSLANLKVDAMKASKTISKDTELLAVTKSKESQSTSGAKINSAQPANQKEKSTNKDNMFATMGNIIQFLKEVDVERRKISWPSRDQVIRETYSVLVLVAVITLLVLSFDWLLGIVFGYLEHFARLHGGGIGKG